MGRVGTGTGILNSVDLETKRNKVEQTGFEVGQSITIQADWIPTTLIPHFKALKYDDQFLQLFNQTIIASLEIDSIG